MPERGQARFGALAWAALAALFVVCAVLNSGGYRYGVGDQAFYVPAVLTHLDPALFPRDRAFIDVQDDLTVFPSAIAWISRTTFVPLPPLFLALHLVTLAAFFGGIVWLGRTLFRSDWAVGALVLTMALRHRITRTGANTLEGYFHPRQLAFAAGLASLAALLRGRPWLAVLLLLGAAFVHPTTALWFGVLVGVAAVVSEPSVRRAFLAIAVGLGATGAWLLWRGPLAEGPVVIDDRWYRIFALKDYLFPTEWPLSAWLANLAYPVAVLAIFVYRRRAGLAVRREPGLVAGVLVLVALFLASLPLVAARIAFAVQLQVPRIFWMADLVATAYVIWLLAEAPFWLRVKGGLRRAALTTFTVVALIAASRGAWVTFVEHPGRQVIDVDTSEGPWGETMDYLATTPTDGHVLADPGHAWRYGESVRVAAERDVFLEEVKDAAMGTYSRQAAERVLERIAAVGDFQTMTAERAQALAARYDLDYLVTVHTLALPLVYANARFRVYRLQ